MRAPALFLALILTCAASAVQKDMLVHTDAFSMTLPGAWEQQPSQDGMAFVRGTDTLYVTTFDSDARKRPVVSRIAEMRRKLIRDLSRGDATCSRVSEATDGDRTIAYFDGEDPRNGKRFFVAVIGLRRIVVTAALYRPLSAPGNGFEDEGRAIMASVH